MNKLIVCMIITSLFGCAGASMIPVSKDAAIISSHAAPICGAQGAQKVAFRQAAVETIRRGYDRFLIIGGQYRNDVGVVGHTPVIAHTTGSAAANIYGNIATAHGTATTTYSGGQPIIGGSHRQGLTVKMFKRDDPAGKNALSARAELGPKWVEYVNSKTITCFD